MVTQRQTDLWEFLIYLPHASCVELLGTFNGWEPALAAELIGDGDSPGWWRLETKLHPGEHEFCYLVDGCTWLPDYAAGGLRRNHEGRWVSQLSIAPEPREAPRAVLLANGRTPDERLPGREAEGKPASRTGRRGRTESATPAPRPPAPAPRSVIRI